MSAPRKNIRIVVISDGTGETATSMTRAALAQFKDRDAFFTRFKNVRSIEQIDSIFTEVAIGHDLVVYTIVDSELREYVVNIARIKHIRILDLLGPILTQLSNVFEQSPLSVPGLLHEVNDEYFKRVEAMEFTLNHDDGRNLESLHLADVVLVGISRTSKTPLSVYLSQHGLKVVNIPLVPGVRPNEDLWKIDQRKIMALTIDPQSLKEIRENRLSNLGSNIKGDYAELAKIVEEVEWANDLFKENKRWAVFNVTNRAIEETAAEVLKLINMRKNNIFKQSKRNI
ncbi:MAG: kinase/pyrophosphorylase [Halobacteriovoraceae bacterium]|nr:kinase/pyrophosphorylase [Halobacteriovoraceae bacterium]